MSVEVTLRIRLNELEDGDDGGEFSENIVYLWNSEYTRPTIEDIEVLDVEEV